MAIMFPLFLSPDLKLVAILDRKVEWKTKKVLESCKNKQWQTKEADI